MPSFDRPIRTIAASVLAMAAATLLTVSAPPLLAKAEATSPYTLGQTYGATLRMLRVDLGLEIIEKDPDASYILFRYRLLEDPKRVVDGAIELVELADRVKIVVKLHQLPESHERVLRDRLVKKLRDDYGEPPKRRAPEKQPEPPQPPDTAPGKPPPS